MPEDVARLIEILGPNWYFAIAPIMILISSITAIAIALWHISTTKRINRTQTTLTLLEQSELGNRHLELVHSYSVVGAVENGFLRLCDGTDELTKSHRQNVIALLNHYEILSIGILHKTLDEKIAKLYLRSIFVHRWRQTLPLIKAWRTGKHGTGHFPDACYNFEKLVKRWS